MNEIQNSMNPAYLFSAIVWGAVGLGFFIYGKKQKSAIPLIGGIVLMGITYLVKDSLNMALVSLAIIAGMYGLKKIM
ncbi:hypothetical protein LLG96_06065 [bacterium]|nr:hypothetical protein [bacterium]